MATGTSERFLTQFRQAWASEPQRPRLQAEIRRMTGADAARCLEVYVDASEASLRDARARKWSLGVFHSLAGVALDRGQPLVAVRFEARVCGQPSVWRDRFNALEVPSRVALAAKAKLRKRSLKDEQRRLLVLLAEAVRSGDDRPVQRYVEKLDFRGRHACLLAYIDGSLRYAPDNARSLRIFYGISTLAIHAGDAGFLTTYRRRVNEPDTTWHLRWTRLPPEYQKELEDSIQLRAAKLRQLEAAPRPHDAPAPSAKVSRRDARPGSATYTKFIELFTDMMRPASRASHQRGTRGPTLEGFVNAQSLIGLRDCLAAYLDASTAYPLDDVQSLSAFHTVASRLITVPDAGSYEALKLDHQTKTRGTVEFERFTALPPSLKKDLTETIARKVRTRARLIFDDTKFDYYRQHGVDPTPEALRRLDPDVDAEYREAVLTALHRCDAAYQHGSTDRFGKAFDEWADLMHEHAQLPRVLIAMLTWTRNATDITRDLQSDLYWYGVLVLQSGAMQRHPEYYIRGLNSEERAVLLHPSLVSQGYRDDFDNRLKVAIEQRLAVPSDRTEGTAELPELARSHAALLAIAARHRFLLVPMDRAKQIYGRLEILKETQQQISFPVYDAANPAAVLSVGQTTGNVFVAGWDKRHDKAFVEVKGLPRVLFEVDSYARMGQIKRDADTYGKIAADNQPLLRIIPWFFEVLGYLPSLVSGGVAELAIDVALDTVSTAVVEAADLPDWVTMPVSIASGMAANAVTSRLLAPSAAGESRIAATSSDGIDPPGSGRPTPTERGTTTDTPSGTSVSSTAVPTAGGTPSPTWRPSPPGSPHASVESLVGTVKRELAEVQRHAPSEKEWKWLTEAIDDHPEWRWENAQFVFDLRVLREGLCDPERLAKVMGDIWLEASKTGHRPSRALVDFFGQSNVRTVKGNLTQDLMKSPFIDAALKSKLHGRYTHLFQLRVAVDVLGRERALNLIKQIASTSGPLVEKIDGWQDFWRGAWDAVFDATEAGFLNRPENLGPILLRNLGMEL